MRSPGYLPMAEKQNVIRRSQRLLGKSLGLAKCLVCKVSASKGVCDDCLNQLEPLTAGCSQCGNPNSHYAASSCAWCQRLAYKPDQIVSYFAYRNCGQELFQLIKYQGYWRLINTLFSRVTPDLLQPFQHMQAPVLVPIPESFRRKWQRSFNPAALIAEALKAKLNAEIMPCLKLKLFQANMVGMGYEARRRAAKNRFKLKTSQLPPSIILVDDVLTSGATLEGATKTLRKAGVKEIGWFSLFRTL